MCECPADHVSPTEPFYVRTTIPQNQTTGPVVSNPTGSHLLCSSASWLLLKINTQKCLRGRKTSLLAFSQNQDRMLSWNPEPPPAGPYKNRQGLDLDQNQDWTWTVSGSCVSGSVCQVFWDLLCRLVPALYPPGTTLQRCLHMSAHTRRWRCPRQSRSHPSEALSGWSLGLRIGEKTWLVTTPENGPINPEESPQRGSRCSVACPHGVAEGKAGCRKPRGQLKSATLQLGTEATFISIRAAGRPTQPAETSKTRGPDLPPANHRGPALDKACRF